VNADLQPWNGLRRPEPTLPSRWYLDEAHFELELQKLWYRHWIYLCRSEALPGPRSFGTFRVGAQTVLMVRDDAGVLRAFHNTCRHRGAALCSAESGRLPAAAITCRYHAFSYGLDGKWVGANTKHSYFFFEVDPGEHHLCASWQSVGAFKNSVGMQSFVAEAGKTYYFASDASADHTQGGGYSFDFSQLDDDDGKYRVKAYKMSKFKSNR